MILLVGLPILVAIFIIIQGFFANSEMAMVSSNRIRLSYLAKNGDSRASIILFLLNFPDRLFGTTLVGINISTVVATVMADHYFRNIFVGHFSQVEEFIPVAILIPLVLEPAVLIFGELFPMSLARKYPNTTAMRNAYLIRAGYIIFYPIMLLVSRISRLIGRLFGSGESIDKISRDELQLLVSGRFSQTEGSTKKIIEDVFYLKELKAEDIMVHLNAVVAIEEEADVEEFRRLISTTNFSRFPVYRDTIFNIVSTAHAVNLLGVDGSEPIKNYTEKLYIIPSAKPALEVLKELQTNRKYMAIVVDEYGAACGIITIEDIVEKIVGDIKDENEIRLQKIKPANPMIFNAHTYLDDFYDSTGIDFRAEDADTIAGIINLATGRIARVKEIIEYKEVRFEVLEASDRAVKTVKLLTPQQAEREER